MHLRCAFTVISQSIIVIVQLTTVIGYAVNYCNYIFTFSMLYIADIAYSTYATVGFLPQLKGMQIRSTAYSKLSRDCPEAAINWRPAQNVSFARNQLGLAPALL